MKYLDKQQYVGAVIMDLSKALDCLPHDLILAKLSMYVLSANACYVLSSCLSNRKQRVKVGQFCSYCLNIIKEVPEGFLSLDPFYLIFL